MGVLKLVIFLVTSQLMMYREGFVTEFETSVRGRRRSLHFC